MTGLFTSLIPEWQPEDGCFIVLLSNPVQNFYAIWARTEGEGGKDKMAESYTEVVLTQNHP